MDERMDGLIDCIQDLLVSQEPGALAVGLDPRDLMDPKADKDPRDLQVPLDSPDFPERQVWLAGLEALVSRVRLVHQETSDRTDRLA